MDDLKLVIRVLQELNLASSQTIVECLKVPIAQKGRLLEVMGKRGLLNAEQRAAVRARVDVLVGAAPQPPTQNPTLLEQRKNILIDLQATASMPSLELADDPGRTPPRGAFRRELADDEDVSTGFDSEPTANFRPSGPTIDLSEDPSDAVPSAPSAKDSGPISKS